MSAHAAPPSPAARGLFRRWFPYVLLGETLGFAVPAAAGAIAYAAKVDGLTLMVMLVAAGAVEGAVLGFSQQAALSPHVADLDGRAWVRNTAIAAAFAWTLGMTPSTVGDSFFGRWWVYVPALLAGGLALLLSIGCAQWLVLRAHVPRAWLWVPANAAAWLAGITWVFAAMAFVSEGDPAWVIALAAGIGGLLMAATAAAFTGAALLRILSFGGQPLREAAQPEARRPCRSSSRRESP